MDSVSPADAHGLSASSFSRLPADVLRHHLFTRNMLDPCSLVMVRFTSRSLRLLCCPPFQSSQRYGRQPPLMHGPVAAAASRGYWSILRWFRHRFGPGMLKSEPLVLRLAVANNADISFVGWLRIEGQAVLDEHACYAAALHGNLSLLQHLLPLVQVTSKRKLVRHAAGSGDIELVQWVVEHLRGDSSGLVAGAASYGKLNVLQWALARAGSVNWPAVALAAASHGRRNIVEWMLAQEPRVISPTTCPRLCPEAAMGGHLQLCKLLRARGFPWSTNVLERVAMGGHLEMLQWAVQDSAPVSSR
jgi:hypothetical protein